MTRNGVAPALTGQPGEWPVELKCPDGLTVVLHVHEPAGEPRGVVLLVHGFAQNHHTYVMPGQNLPRALSAAGYVAAALDFRGCGASAAPLGHLADSLFELIEYDSWTALDYLLSHYPGRPVFLLGHSMGGCVTYALCGLRKAQLQGVILLAAPFRLDRHAGFRAVPKALRARLTSLLEDSFRRNPPPRVVLPTRTLARGLALNPRPWNHRWWRFPLWPWSSGHLDNPDLLYNLVHAFEPAKLRVLGEMMHLGLAGEFIDVRRGRNYSRLFAESQVPCLVAAAAGDRLVPPATVRPAFLASRSPDRSYICFGEQQAGYAVGHLDLVFGSRSAERVWPRLIQWLNQRTLSQNGGNGR